MNFSSTFETLQVKIYIIRIPLITCIQQEDFLKRSLIRLRPKLFNDRKLIASNYRQTLFIISRLNGILCKHLRHHKTTGKLEDSINFLKNIVDKKNKVKMRLLGIRKTSFDSIFQASDDLIVTQISLNKLNEEVEELFPIALRSALLYSICKSVTVLSIHYQVMRGSLCRVFMTFIYRLHRTSFIVFLILWFLVIKLNKLILKMLLL